MNPDDELCLCFHVTQRKVVNYIRVEKPKRPAQLSDCFGAGTGCGWCVPFLHKLFAEGGRSEDLDTLSAEDYARRRDEYIESGKGTPPPPRDRS